jgi:YD repeat-containing protein
MTAGDIYTVAGSSAGVQGLSGDSGPAISALLYDPQSVTVDSSGDLIIADTGNSRIQMVAAGTTTPYLSFTTANDIYTIAGSSTGVSGHTGNGGAATSAYLSGPAGVATGYGNNNLYIADSSNNRVQEVAASGGTQWNISMTAGDIYTVAGNASGTSGHSGNSGVATSAYLYYPSSVAQSSAGTLFIADSDNNRVQDVCSATGSCGTANDVYTFAGNAAGTAGHTGDAGAATAAYLSDPTSVVSSNGQQIYIADEANNRIQEVAYSGHTEFGMTMTAGDIYTIAGSATGSHGYSGNGGLATSALLNASEQIALDSSHNLYIADTANDRVREVSASTADISAFAGNGTAMMAAGDSGSALASGIYGPAGIVTDNAGDIFVGDNNGRVQEMAASSHSQFGVSMTTGDIYTVAGGGSGAIPGPAIGAQIGFDTINTIALDPSGDLYIAVSCEVLEVPAASGTQWGISMTANDIYDVAGGSTCGSSGDGGAATAAKLSMSEPSGLAFDSAGDLFITTNSSIQEVPANSGTQWGISMTANDIYDVAGSSSGSTGFSGDSGVATSALLNNPDAIVIDSAGDLYIADSNNGRVREVAHSTGTQWGVSMTANDIYTVAGGGTGSLPGAATSIPLAGPLAIAADGAGDLYLASGSAVLEMAASSGPQWSQNMQAGYIYLVAGNGTGYSGDGGPATSASLRPVYGLAVGPSGSLYIDDSQNSLVREVAGQISQFPVWPASGDVTVTETTGAEVTFYPKTASCVLPLVSAVGYCVLPEDIGSSLTYNSGSGTYSFSPDPTETYTFNSTGQLTGETNAAGDTLSITYGSPSPGSGNCPSTATSCNTITSAGGRALVIGLNSSGLITSVTDPLGRRFLYAYNSSNDLTSVTDPKSRVTSFNYGNGTTGNPLLVNDLLTVTKPKRPIGWTRRGQGHSERL